MGERGEAMKVEIAIDKRDWHPSPLPGQVVLVTSVDASGRPAVAPKSWVSMAAFGPPPVVMFGCNLKHETARNVLRRKEFVINVPPRELAAACWGAGDDTAGPRESRFARHGLTPVPAVRVRPPRIRECRAHLECRLEETRAWGDEVAIFGRIVAVSIDRALQEGEIAQRYRALAPFFYLEERCCAGLGPAEVMG